jgi:hypothetical protein
VRPELLAAGIVAVLLFLFLSPRAKALVALVLMMQCFDVVPNLLFGYYLWDYGAVLMIITAADVFLRRPVVPATHHVHMFVLKVYLIWLVICFAWSVIVYQYPLLPTIKNARYMLVGYSMVWIFARLFAVQPGSFEFLMKWIYRITFALMPVVVLQYVLNKQLLFGLVSEYQGELRALPVFLPLCMLNLWIILSKLLSSERLKTHEVIYLLLTLTTIALSFTRGIYLSVFLISGLMLWVMARQGRLKASRIVVSALAAVLLVIVLAVAGVAQKFGERAASGLRLVTASESTQSSETRDDTFSGRLGLLGERFGLAWEHNPLVGYGFLHEDNVPSELRSRLRYGTVLAGTAADPTAFSRSYEYTGSWVLGFYTSDIAWADIVLCSGYVGVAILLLFMVSFVFQHLSNRQAEHPMGAAVRNGLFLQMVTLMLLTGNGNTFFGSIHVPALLLAGYALTRNRTAQQTLPAQRPAFANLMSLQSVAPTQSGMAIRKE